jgi:hypothetical protein
MGQGHVQKTTGNGTSRIQPTARDANTSSVANTSFVQNVQNETEYAKQATGSNTITPRLLTKEEISKLGPSRPRRQVNVRNICFGQLRCDHPEPLGANKYTFTVEGIQSGPTLRKIEKILQEFLLPLKFRNLTVLPTEHGAEVTFDSHSKWHRAEDFKESLELAENFLRNLHALGLDNFMIDLSNSSSVLSNLREPSWRCDPYPDDTETMNRLDCIEELVGQGHSESAYKIFSDLSTWCEKQFLPTCLNDQQRSLFVLLKQPKAQRLRGFTTGLCGICESYRHAVQTGKMVLRELLSLENNTEAILDRHLQVFKAIAAQTKDPKAAICELLDRSKTARGAILQNQKARQLLLMVDPDIAKVFGQIELNANDVFLDRWQRLQQQGFTFTFPGDFPFGDEPVEIVAGGTVDHAAVDLLLELAEAAVHCTGYVNWVTGVLRYLSERVLDVDDLRQDQLARAKALRNAIQMAVRFHPDPQVAAQFDTIKALTDEAVAELGVWYGQGGRSISSDTLK